QYVRNANRTLFADLTPEQTLELTYGLQQYRGGALADLAGAGIPASYVKSETARAVANAGTMKIWPGIDIDIPTAATSKKTRPSEVYAAVKAALEGGAQGALLSRKYSEMLLDNTRAAGRAVRDLKLA